MFEGLLERLLLKLFGEYVEELNKEHLHVSVWAGDVVLKDLKLKPGALDELKLPISVIHGEINSLSLKVPWTRIGSSPVQLTLDGLYAIAAPNVNQHVAEEEEEDDSDVITSGMSASERVAWAIKSRLLAAHEAQKQKLAALEEEDGSRSGESQTYSERMIAKIIANLQLTVKNVHVRYEDIHTIPGQMFAVGLTIGSLSAQTTDEHGTVKYVNPTDVGGVTHKLVQLKGGSMYWNSNRDDSEMWHALSHAARVQKLARIDLVAADKQLVLPSTASPSAIAPSPRKSPHAYDYILHPLDITMRAVLHESLDVQAVQDPSSVDRDKPKHYLSFELHALSLQLSQNQYRDLVKILDFFSETQMRQQLAIIIAKLPKFPPRPTLPSVSGQTPADSLVPRSPPSPLSPPSASLSSSSSSPTSWCRVYWRHAIKCVIHVKYRRSRFDWSTIESHSAARQSYIRLWARSQNVPWLPALNEEEKRKLKGLELRLPYESIVVFRLLAESQLKLQSEHAEYIKQKRAAQRTEQNANQSKGFWAKMGAVFVGGQQEVAIDAEAAQLLAAINLSPEQQREVATRTAHAHRIPSNSLLHFCVSQTVGASSFVLCCVCRS